MSSGFMNFLYFSELWKCFCCNSFLNDLTFHGNAWIDICYVMKAILDDFQNLLCEVLCHFKWPLPIMKMTTQIFTAPTQHLLLLEGFAYHSDLEVALINDDVVYHKSSCKLKVVMTTVPKAQHCLPLRHSIGFKSWLILVSLVTINYNWL